MPKPRPRSAKLSEFRNGWRNTRAPSRPWWSFSTSGVGCVVVAAVAVGDAVEITDRVIHDAARDVAAQLQAEIAIGHEAGWQAALDEPQIGCRHQAFETDRHFELAGSDDGPRFETCGHECHRE